MIIVVVKRVAGIAVLAAGFLACDGLLGVDFDDARPGPANDGGEAGAATEAGPAEAAASIDAAPIDAAPNVCPHTRGANGVLIHASSATYCIDETEVTRAQYAVFLAAGDVPDKPAFCAWDNDFKPPPWDSQVHDDHPITKVDYCDAYMYCAWAGKFLCGRLGADPGGGSPKSYWGAACTKEDEQMNPFPYGKDYDPLRCNGKDANRGGTAPVKSFPECQGAYPGLYDMSGNVTEWTAGCGNEGMGDFSKDVCSFRGGSYGGDGTALTCGATFLGTRDSAWDDVGFRCCFDSNAPPSFGTP